MCPLTDSNPGPHYVYLPVFYSPGENCDSLPTHTKFSGGKMGSRIVFGKMTPTPPENTPSVQKKGCQNARIAGSKRGVTIVKVGGRFRCAWPYPANLTLSKTVSTFISKSNWRIFVEISNYGEKRAKKGQNRGFWAFFGVPFFRLVELPLKGRKKTTWTSSWSRHLYICGSDMPFISPNGPTSFKISKSAARGPREEPQF